jgi:ADP-ribosylglycohydrolase
MRVSPVAWAANDLEFKYLMDMAEKSAACSHNHPEGIKEFKYLMDMAEKSAACSHNHPEGIKGAQTVALAIQYGIELPCYHPNFTQEHVKELVETCASRSGYNINIRKEDVINRFDETCQGTVPVALWIIGESTSFEDAVRKAVSLGADADTLGAIVGSIAEAIWGIPMDMQIQAMEYLPTDMRRVVLQFYRRYIKDSFLAGYGDEGAAIDLIPED